ncbi:MAG: ORF6N domain-containing protein [Bryobacteraceae bacterium]
MRALQETKRLSSPDGRLPVPVGLIQRRIYLIRGQKAMLDSDLAEIYGVPTFRLNEAVKRNRKRFPSDFMLQLNRAEADFLTSQAAMSKKGRGGRRTLPYAFTEHGVAMLAPVLNSDRAAQMNIVIIRAFVKLREVVASHKELARKVSRLDTTQKRQGSIILAVVEEIKRLRQRPPATKRRIGFLADN